MAGNITNKYGTSNQTITVTLASLANAAMRGSLAVDNSSNLFTDALVQLKVKSGASGVSSTGYVHVYAYGTSDGGTTYSALAGGTDAAFTGQAASLMPLGRIPVVANATTYAGGPWSVASAFGGTLPDHWGIVIDNESGAALDATEGSHDKHYQGAYGAYT